MEMNFALRGISVIHRRDRFTSPPPPEGTRTADFIALKKSIALSRAWTSEPWVQWQTNYPQHHRGRPHFKLHVAVFSPAFFASPVLRPRNCMLHVRCRLHCYRLIVPYFTDCDIGLCPSQWPLGLRQWSPTVCPRTPRCPRGLFTNFIIYF
jgi:hypothetical protein